MLAILAAGAGTRFDGGDKLLAQLNGAPVAGHVINACAKLDVHKIAVVPATNSARSNLFAGAGYELTYNDNIAAGQSQSVALAAQTALAQSSEYLLIALADMPFVPAAHFCELITGFERTGTGQVSLSGRRRGVPALFARADLELLLSASGDIGARVMPGLLSRMNPVRLDEAFGRDIDTQADLL